MDFGLGSQTYGAPAWLVVAVYLLANLASYASFPLACGLLFHYVRDAYAIGSDEGDTGAF